ncbi:wax ester/triacylglycerol synthase domain-containing protein [Amycolatopsis sp. RTGN1]|uniref:wax ester/triacylglycerol synthase domain-containing protein n=1 Tax=Amycolatopsis ponsaeliensis TaxID=2992142 RepID=UPI002551449C|nr:wax ester/triacylglycerol synthase domain-containing protein [Amycolatopsis sp. RTGN1]
MPRSSPSPPPVVDRASSADRAFLAMDTGAVPEQFGVLLDLGPATAFDLARARQLVAGRVPAVPRLRQVLVRAPFGGGGPVWVDDGSFDVRRHVRAVVCPPPGDRRALLDTAVDLVETPLPRDAALWSMAFVTGLADGRVALVIVLHHVLADGVGGLAVLADLVDQGTGTPEVSFPRPRPTAGALARDNVLARMRALRRCGRAVRALRASMSAAGGLRPPRAAPCSLIRPTGPRHRLAVVRTERPALAAAAHRHGASVNDAVLVAVAGALHRLLVTRGESVGTFAVAVPVSGRRASRGGALGNMVSPMLVQVPGTGDVAGRLERVAAEVRAAKAAATGPPPIAVLGGLFRLLAAVGGYRWYMSHQRRMHTLVSHVRGPAEPVTFGGMPVRSAIPVGVGDGGNLTVFFEVLSYAETVTISVVADRDRFPDLGTLADGLRAELGLVLGSWPGKPCPTKER